MQAKRTPQANENASFTLASPDDYLTDAECKCIGLHAMSTALTELLSAPYDADYSEAARRRLGAAMEVAGSIEDRAREVTESVEDARMIVIGLQRDECRQDTETVVSSLRCAHSDLIRFADAVSDILGGLRIASLAVANYGGLSTADVNEVAAHVAWLTGRVKTLGQEMRACLDTENGNPGLRQDRVAEAGAA